MLIYPRQQYEHFVYLKYVNNCLLYTQKFQNKFQTCIIVYILHHSYSNTDIS